ncbi:MAG: bifunctional nuclease family protein [Planctomycetes bacterium]|nr:bifunctional nuclease family protein [Planctomycetota bacterium]
MAEKLYEIEVRKVVPTEHGIAVVLGNDEQAFVMHIGTNEGAALIRALKGEHADRPLTHDLLEYVLDGFEVQIKHVVISDIVDRTFCATLTLQQRCKNGDEWAGLTNEVKIDARPSDCIVLAVKRGAPIFVSDVVLSQVPNAIANEAKRKKANPLGLSDFSSFQDQLDSMDFDELLGADED